MDKYDDLGRTIYYQAILDCYGIIYDKRENVVQRTRLVSGRVKILVLLPRRLTATPHLLLLLLLLADLPETTPTAVNSVLQVG